MEIKLNSKKEKYIEVKEELSHLRFIPKITKGRSKDPIYYLKQPLFLDTETSHNHDEEDPIGWIYQWCFEFHGEYIAGRYPSDLIKELLRNCLLGNVGEYLTLGMQVACLAESYHFLGHGADFLSSCNSCFDLSVFEKICYHRSEHCSSVVGSSSQLSCTRHDLQLLTNLIVFFGTQVIAQRVELFLDLVERLLAKVPDLHHFFFGFFYKVVHSVDTRTLQAVKRAHG